METEPKSGTMAHDTTNLGDPIPGTDLQRNTGEACWSCGCLMSHAPAKGCIYPDSHTPRGATAVTNLNVAV